MESSLIHVVTGSFSRTLARYLYPILKSLDLVVMFPSLYFWFNAMRLTRSGFESRKTYKNPTLFLPYIRCLMLCGRAVWRLPCWKTTYCLFAFWKLFIVTQTKCWHGKICYQKSKNYTRQRSQISYSYLPFQEMYLFYVFRKFSFVLCAAIGQNLELFEWKPHRDSVLGFSYISCWEGLHFFRFTG